MYTYHRAAGAPDEATQKRAGGFVRRNERLVKGLDEDLAKGFEVFKGDPCQGIIEMARKIAAGEAVSVEQRLEVAKALEAASNKLLVLVQEFENLQD